MDTANIPLLDRIIRALKELCLTKDCTIDGLSNGENPIDRLRFAISGIAEELQVYKTKIDNQASFLHDILGSIGEVIYLQRVPTQSTSFSYGFISARSKEIIGLGSSELMLQPEKWHDAVHPDDRKMRLDMIDRALTGEEVVITYRIFHAGKSCYRWIEDRIFPKFDESREVAQLHGSVRDVTEQQQTILDLEKTGQLVTRLITSSDQVFYIVTLDQLDPFKNTFTYLSPHVEDIIGFSVEDVRNDPHAWIRAIHPEDLQAVKDVTREMFSTKLPCTRVYRMKHKHSGQFVWIEDYLVPIMDEKGWIREFYASARDISGRRLAELEKERLMLELNRKHDDLMQFSHIVSNNLRSPVASILGLAELLNDRAMDEEYAQTQRYILRAAKSMDNILRDLSSVLSVRSTLEEKKQFFKISDIIADIVINVKTEIEQTGTKIELAVAHRSDEINSIKSYVQSSLYNLISNSIKYRDEHRSPVISINVAKCGERTVIRVGDNGSGIDLAMHMETIFSLYGRLNSSREGKGLGLYMTRTQIESLGGRIAVESEIGKGTVFTIVL